MRKVKRGYGNEVRKIKIEIQVADAKVNVGKTGFEGYTLTIGKSYRRNCRIRRTVAIIKNWKRR